MSESKDTVWIAVGLGSLGLAAGSLTGASATAGATQALVTGVLTFVGGTVLSYAAFATKQQVQTKKAKERNETNAELPPPKIQRIGIGMMMLSGALLVGALIGLWFRSTDPFGWAPPRQVHAAPASEPAAPQTASFGFQSGPGQNNAVVKRVRKRLLDNFYDENAVIKDDIRELADLASQCPPR